MVWKQNWKCRNDRTFCSVLKFHYKTVTFRVQQFCAKKGTRRAGLGNLQTLPHTLIELFGTQSQYIINVTRSTIWSYNPESGAIKTIEYSRSRGARVQSNLSDIRARAWTALGLTIMDAEIAENLIYDMENKSWAGAQIESGQLSC